jgi:beta-N-acetylhexosaminidase
MRATADLGQLLIIGFDGTEMTGELEPLLRKIQPAGVVLFARNIATAGQTHQLLRDCRRLVARSLFACVDLEGGKVDRLRNVIGPAPSPAEVFATGDRRLFHHHGRVIGENCRALGFNIDFAPCLDLALEASRSVMSSRAVSADPRQAVVYGREFLSGLRDADVLGCGKHFPGLGEGNLDSHHDLPIIEKSLAKLWEQDLYPYRAMRRELPAVMISHAAYPAVTRGRIPASLSPKWINSVLRKRIGYSGLVISDDLEMGGVQAARPTPQAAVEHIRAGGDLALICHRADFIEQAFELVSKEYARNRTFARRADDSIRRVLAFKKKYAPILRPAPRLTPAKVERLTRQLWDFSERVRLQSLTGVPA